MDYYEALNYLKSRRSLGTKPGLERVKALLKMFSNPQRVLPCIHVAGSNGKGSTSAFLAGILTKQGHKVGQFSSPYFVSPSEMFKIGESKIEDQAFEILLMRQKIIVNT